MILPSGFQFSQGSLQDYVDCPRRFQLRYVRRLRWPAIETEPALENERHLRQGAAFHRLIRQHLMGIPVKTLSRTVNTPELRRWWRSYLESGLVGLPVRRYPEVRLSTVVGNYRLMARYDLIAIDPGGEVLIVDWKTNRKHPGRLWLSDRLQTHVYPFVLVQAGDMLDSETVIRPDCVRMIYWFANFAATPEQFVYDASQHRADGEYLLNLVREVEERVGACDDGDLLPPSEDRSCCRICCYRSLCQREVEPGGLDEGWEGITSDDPFDVSLDFEQIAELDMG